MSESNTHPKILIVEDEPAIADTIQYALETEGFQIVLHSIGGGVMELLARERIDLIVLDIGLPDINGLELCKEIRKTHTIPVIFLTARAEEIDRVVGLEIGADDYVIKPFSPRELSARVKAVLRRTLTDGGGDDPVPPVFQVNENQRKIYYFGTPLDLSRYEFDILKTFISRPGRVLTRDRLMDMVWKEPEASMDRTVDAHIKNLRGKLKKINPDADPIATHRGVGYSFKETP